MISLQELPKEEAGIKISDNGVSYVIPDAPFEFQYSYTETPKVKPLKLREAPITPFGPSTMPRPWTGRKPLPPSKKKIDFDSFKLPPPHKKGVKPVQHPGPFLPGSGPKYVQSREEILGEPLTKEEIDDLVKGSLRSKRQLNMGMVYASIWRPCFSIFIYIFLNSSSKFRNPNFRLVLLKFQSLEKGCRNHFSLNHCKV